MSSLRLRSLIELGSAPVRRARARGQGRPAWRFAPRVMPLEVRTLLSTLTVTSDADSGPGSLRGAIALASSGDTIKFAGSAYGTITLTSGPLVVQGIDLTIQGPGSNKLTISGNDAYTVFELGILPPSFSTPNNVTISGVTIADGNAVNNDDGGSGGAIAEAVNLTLTASVLRGNVAPGGSGGAIYNGGGQSGLSITAQNDLFDANTAGSASDPNFSVLGGAIDAAAASITTVSACTFLDNQAIGQAPQGGAIQASNNPLFFDPNNGSLAVTGSTFRGNVASGSLSSSGGAIWTDPLVAISIDSSQFLNNVSEAGSPFPGPGIAQGGAIDINPGLSGFPTFAPTTATITNTLFAGNVTMGTGTSSTGAQGARSTPAASASGEKESSRSAAARSWPIPAQGDSTDTFSFGGPANGGAISDIEDFLAITSDTFSSNEAAAGSSLLGVQVAFGGAISLSSAIGFPAGTTSSISDSLFTGNKAVGGIGPSFDSAVAGGALSLGESPTVVTDTSFLGNQALGTAGGFSIGGAIENDSSVLTIQGGTIAGNVASGGQGSDSTGTTGGPGGYGQGGGIADFARSSVTLEGTTIVGNMAVGGAGGNGTTRGAGGNGEGGGIYVDSSSTLVMTGGSIIGNQAKGGAQGDGQGGGVFVSGSAAFSDVLITLNAAVGGKGGGQGTGGGLYISAGTVTLSNNTKSSPTSPQLRATTSTGPTPQAEERLAH